MSIDTTASLDRVVAGLRLMLLQGVVWMEYYSHRSSPILFCFVFLKKKMFLAVQLVYSVWKLGRCIGAYHFCERSEAIVAGFFSKKKMASNAFLVDRDIKSTKRCAFIPRLH